MPESIFDVLSPLRIFAAKEFPKGLSWLGVKEPLTLAQLRGNIVVLDFWTYCCINCMHTLPVLREIEEKYSGKPVIVIGVHSPKFTNEQDRRNVESAIERYGITHPVVMDERMRIWKAYGAQGWPTIVIVDPLGNIVYRRSGEGQGAAIAQEIDLLLQKHAMDNTLKERVAIEMQKPKRPAATLSFPGKIAFSPDGKSLAVSDSNNNRILVVDAKSGKTAATIGGKRGFMDGSFEEAAFAKPQGIAWTDRDTIYVADTENHSIRRADLRSRFVATVAGNGKQSNWLALGGDATKIALSSPWDLAYKDGILYIAMAGTNQIWAYGANDRRITPFAGSGFEGLEDGKGMGSLLAQPSGLSISGDFLYVADSEASAIRQIEIPTKAVRTLSGKGLFSFGYRDGPLKGSQFQHPIGICAVGDTVYVADTYNQSIRRIDLKKGEVSTVVGGKDHPGTCRIDDPKCDTLALYEPNDVKWRDGKLYIADTNNHLIRIFDLKTNLLSTLEIGGGR